jgi:hypothetical protein
VENIRGDSNQRERGMGRNSCDPPEKSKGWNLPKESLDAAKGSRHLAGMTWKDTCHMRATPAGMIGECRTVGFRLVGHLLCLVTRSVHALCREARSNAKRPTSRYCTLSDIPLDLTRSHQDCHRAELKKQGFSILTVLICRGATNRGP